jgi:hypothetical protein
MAGRSLKPPAIGVNYNFVLGNKQWGKTLENDGEGPNQGLGYFLVGEIRKKARRAAPGRELSGGLVIFLANLSDGQRKIERCAFSELAVEPDPSPLHLNQGLGDVQAKPGTGHIPDVLIFRPEKFLENFNLFFWGNPITGVLHADANHLEFDVGVITQL